MLYMRRTSKLEELLESVCALFICTVWPGKEKLEMKGTTCPLSLGRFDNVYSINGQNSESMNGKKGERGSGAGSGVSVWQDLLLISEPFIHRLVINSPLNTSFSSPLRPRRLLATLYDSASQPILHETFFLFPEYKKRSKAVNADVREAYSPCIIRENNRIRANLDHKVILNQPNEKSL